MATSNLNQSGSMYFSEVRPQEKITKQLRTLTTGELRLYALIDAAHTATELQMIRQHVFFDAALGLFAGMPEQDAQSAGPFLLQLNPFETTHEARISWLIKAQILAPCVTWIWSEAIPSVLHRHLQQQLIAKLPDGNEALLRFYDPRVLQQLLTTLFNTEQKKALLGPIVRWHWYLPETGQQAYPTDTTAVS
jgi:hypothetical protein